MWVLRVVLCILGLAVATTTAAADTEAAAVVQGSLESVDLEWKNALLPCVCANGVLDCSFRAKTFILTEDLCEKEPIVALFINNNLFADIPEGYETAIKVNASHNRITGLPRKFLLNPEIKLIDLSWNVISNASDELNFFTHLEYLDLKNNEDITHLQFLPLTCNLVHLDVSHNLITDLATTLKQCNKLKFLDLSNNNITSLPPDLFDMMSILGTLNLGQNQIAGSLTKETFLGLKNLRELDISGIGLTNVSREFFDTLRSLDKLILSDNNFTFIPEYAFSPLIVLKYLDLSRTNIDSFPMDLLDNIHSLEHLYLSENMLSVVPAEAFKRLAAIRTVYPTNANISRITGDLFSSLKQLRSLSLRGNQLTTLPEGLLSELEKIDTLDLSNNPWDKLPVSELKRAKHILFDSCGLNSLGQNAFPKASRLVTLSLGQNDISSLDETSFEDLTAIRTLNLGGNSLTTLPEKVFRNLGSIKMLNLTQNSLDKLPASIFTGLINLKQILLAHNNITTLSGHIFDDLITLEVLDLSNNQLTMVAAEMYINMRALRKLSFKNNRLTALPNVSHAHAAVLMVTFDGNAILRPEEQVLRQWISGDDFCYVELTGVNPDEVHWLVTEPQIRVMVDASDRCRCGYARHRRAVLRLCLNKTCPAHEEPKTWLGELLLSLN